MQICGQKESRQAGSKKKLQRRGWQAKTEAQHIFPQQKFLRQKKHLKTSGFFFKDIAISLLPFIFPPGYRNQTFKPQKQPRVRNSISKFQNMAARSILVLSSHQMNIILIPYIFNYKILLTYNSHINFTQSMTSNLIVKRKMSSFTLLQALNDTAYR